MRLSVIVSAVLLFFSVACPTASFAWFGSHVWHKAKHAAEKAGKEAEKEGHKLEKGAQQTVGELKDPGAIAATIGSATETQLDNGFDSLKSTVNGSVISTLKSLSSADLKKTAFLVAKDSSNLMGINQTYRVLLSDAKTMINLAKTCQAKLNTADPEGAVSDCVKHTINLCIKAAEDAKKGNSNVEEDADDADHSHECKEAIESAAEA